MSVISTLKKIGAAVTKPAPIVAAAETHPISYIKDPKGTVKEFLKQPLGVQMVEGAIAGASLGALGTGKLPAIAKFVAKTAAPIVATKAGAITAAVTVPFATGALVASSTTRKVAAEVINPIANLERGAKFVETIKGSEEFWTKVGTYGILGGAAAALFGGAGYMVAKAGDELPQSRDVDYPKIPTTPPITPPPGIPTTPPAGPDVLKDETNGQISTITETPTTGEVPINAANGSKPVLPETTSIKARKKRYKPRTAQKTTQMIQSVRVNVGNKRFIKQCYYG